MTILKKAKLKLTVDLMNNRDENAVQTAKKSLLSISGIGRFLGLTMKSKSQIDRSRERRIYAMQFENATLDLDTITNPRTRTQLVNGFNLQ